MSVCKQRPCIVVTNDEYNKRSPVIQVVPITGWSERKSLGAAEKSVNRRSDPRLFHHPRRGKSSRWILRKRLLMFSHSRGILSTGQGSFSASSNQERLFTIW